MAPTPISVAWSRNHRTGAPEQPTILPIKAGHRDGESFRDNQVAPSTVTAVVVARAVQHREGGDEGEEVGKAVIVIYAAGRWTV